jgi:hypothetical protein
LFDTEHFPETLKISAFVDLGIGGSMCHGERCFDEKAIYINLSGSFRIFYRLGNVNYGPDAKLLDEFADLVVGMQLMQHQNLVLRQGESMSKDKVLIFPM